MVPGQPAQLILDEEDVLEDETSFGRLFFKVQKPKLQISCLDIFGKKVENPTSDLHCSPVSKDPFKDRRAGLAPGEACD